MITTILTSWSATFSVWWFIGAYALGLALWLAYPHRKSITCYVASTLRTKLH